LLNLIRIIAGKFVVACWKSWLLLQYLHVM